MDEKKLEAVRFRSGFIAALDQSGGSTGKTLERYGIPASKYSTEEEMFDLIHEMRKRVFTSKVFTSEKILGAILFYKTMMSKVDKEYTADYLWNEKHIVSFLKVDKGLKDIDNGVQLMKDIPNLEDTLDLAIERGIFGTKRRSVTKACNADGIKAVVEQQFEIAKVIASKGLVPIIEPEVDINAVDKEKCEEVLRKYVMEELNKLDEDTKVMFKFTIPSVDNYYEEVMNDKHVVKVVALSGGYERVDACERLSRNKGMIASFSRALLEGLNVNDSDEEFDKKLAKSIDMIYKASI